MVKGRVPTQMGPCVHGTDRIPDCKFRVPGWGLGQGCVWSTSPVDSTSGEVPGACKLQLPCTYIQPCSPWHLMRTPSPLSSPRLLGDPLILYGWRRPQLL